jgi:hypothetical protein
LKVIKVLARKRKLAALTPGEVTRLENGNRKARAPTQIRIGARMCVGLLFIDVLVGYSRP